MTDQLAPRLLIPDPTPLSLLAMVGKEALDWLFVPGIEVWVTDMVRHEASRNPDPRADFRTEHRKALRDWFAENVGRIKIRITPEGQDYEREMRNWVRGGSSPEDKPSWRDRSELGISQVLAVVSRLIGSRESVIVLADDRSARALLLRIVREDGLNADLMATETFLTLLERDHGVAKAGAARQAIALAGGSHDSEPSP